MTLQVHLDALGCRLNEAELARWADEFRARGHTMTSDPGAADLIIINTCAVTREAIKKSRQLIRRSQRRNPHARLVISGCHASLAPQTVAQMGVDLIVTNQDKDELVDRVLKKWPAEAALSAPAVVDMPLARGHHRAFVKVQDGCRHRCTFCIVTVARGAERSRPAGAIIDQINQLSARGVQEVVLTGVHLGGYGSEFGSDLGKLVAQILADTDMPRLRMGSLEPWALPDQLLAAFSNHRLLPHLHLPLQSGSAQILKRMARRCRTADFAQLVATLRACYPDFNITTDIIVGFPGETEALWQESVAFISDMAFSHCHIFSYSRHPGTVAGAFPEQVPEATRRARSQALHILSAEMRRAFLLRQIGRREAVLWEGQTREGGWKGYTTNYLRAVLPQDCEAPQETISIVELLGIDDAGQLLAHVIGSPQSSARKTDASLRATAP